MGFLSFFLGILCFYQKDDTRLKVTMVIMCISHAIHYAMMGATTACIGATLAIARTGLSIKTSSAAVAYVFILITLIFGLLGTNSVVSEVLFGESGKTEIETDWEGDGGSEVFH